ncbi:MAG TPA: hypothetical protein PKZ97_03025 [Azospirillaceae bacterium]|nr:hypothetical protein [Azospirillaceae bacterium]
MSVIAAEPPPSRLQHSLFADLPETARRRPPRRSRAPLSDDEREHAPAALDNERPKIQFIPAPPPPPPDPAEMSQAELRALVAALPDAKLAFLLLESARETRRRVAPAVVDLDFDAADGTPPEPNPALLRAAATAAGELSGEDDHSGGYGVTPNGKKRASGRTR